MYCPTFGPSHDRISPVSTECRSSVLTSSAFCLVSRYSFVFLESVAGQALDLEKGILASRCFSDPDVRIVKPQRPSLTIFDVSGHRFRSPSTILRRIQPHGGDVQPCLLTEA